MITKYTEQILYRAFLVSNCGSCFAQLHPVTSAAVFYGLQSSHILNLSVAFTFAILPILGEKMIDHADYAIEETANAFPCSAHMAFALIMVRSKPPGMSIEGLEISVL